MEGFRGKKGEELNIQGEVKKTAEKEMKDKVETRKKNGDLKYVHVKWFRIIQNRPY